MFLHANLMHLLFNSIALKVFSRDVELIFGYKKFLFIYFISGLLGTGLVAGYKYWQKRKREHDHARFLKIFEDGDDIFPTRND